MTHEKIQKQFCEYLEYDLRLLIEKRVSAFNSQLEYIKTQNNTHLTKLYSVRWNDEMLRVVFVLNSFYQLVLGPLASSARISSPCGLGREVPIIYGSSISFNTSRNRKINKAVEIFDAIIREAYIDHHVMGLNSANDIIYKLSKDLYEDR